ncbi:MAG TPA: S-methyl-5-thioribose-1-phosphate isomerase [Elusimicrobiales bacterium]|nr:S-methyl-5-thioribose-1-phosphate isomerase [Elusimicrobiales bacterium]HPO95862.1 S-methyl-5-thioribose-1-phosphate isomerase [Elusimicrobiales bacterium]
MIPKRLKYQKNALFVLDQREIPYGIKYFKAKTAEDAAKSIKEMMVRGAPLIGDTAAMGYVLGIDNIIKKDIRDKSKIIKILNSNAIKLKSSRPTAVSLFKAIDRVHSTALKLISSMPQKISHNNLEELRNQSLRCAYEILKEDKNSTLNIAKNGIKLLKKDSAIITYCNTGALATYGIGTALGIITEGYLKGKIKFVYACETRPYLQGARLTAWELLKNKIPSNLICDNMAGWIMKTQKIDAVIIGADRIAANGDTANKIGSYTLAILAKFHKIPFYVAAPTETIDIKTKSGKEIKIEERKSEEVVKIKGIYITHPKVKAYHPAFDVVPADLITAIITEKGTVKNPNFEKIKKHLRY